MRASKTAVDAGSFFQSNGNSPAHNPHARPHYPMKKSIFLFCAFLFASSLWGAPKQPVEIPRNDFAAKKGDWCKEKNWALGRVPKGECARIVNGATVTLAAVVPEVDSLIVGSRPQPSTLVVDKGADLKVRSIVVIWSNAENAQARFEMRGGQIQTATDNVDGAFLVGTGGTFSGASVATLSGGKIIGSVLVGSTLQNSHTGKVIMEGSAPCVVAGTFARSHFLVTPSGTVEFIFDEKGVGCFDYTQSSAGNRLMPGSTVIVDGGKYQGGARTVPLFMGSRVDDEGARVEIKGFSPAYKTEILKMNKKVPGLYLKISTAK